MLSALWKALRLAPVETDATLREEVRRLRADLRAREREAVSAAVALGNARLTIETQRRELETLRAADVHRNRWQ